MRILLDECLPRQLRSLLTGHSVSSVTEAGWSGVENGELLRVADEAFDVLITVDKRFASPSAHGTAVILLRVISNDLESILPLVSDLLKALETIRRGQRVVLGT